MALGSESISFTIWLVGPLLSPWEQSISLKWEAETSLLGLKKGECPSVTAKEKTGNRRRAPRRPRQPFSPQFADSVTVIFVQVLLWGALRQTHSPLEFIAIQLNTQMLNTFLYNTGEMEDSL